MNSQLFLVITNWMETITPFFDPKNTDTSEKDRITYLQILLFTTMFKTSESCVVSGDNIELKMGDKIFKFKRGESTEDFAKIQDVSLLLKNAKTELEDYLHLICHLDSLDRQLSSLLSLSEDEINLFFRQISKILPSNTDENIHDMLESTSDRNRQLKIFSLLARRSKDPQLKQLLVSKLTQFLKGKDTFDPTEVQIRLFKLLLIPLNKH